MNDFEEYIRQGEPEKREKGYAWQTAIGLQAVDDLKPSEYLIQTARQHIEGDITIEEAKQLIDSYYQSKTVRAGIEDRTEEADKVSARIAEILSEKTFTFSPVEYITIHRRLFQGIYKFAGKIRDYNITKKEWVLKGETVLYASADSIRETLDYDFMQEKNFSYKGKFTLLVREILAQRLYLLSNICVLSVSTSATMPLPIIHGISEMPWFVLITIIWAKAFTLLQNILKHSSGT